MLWTLEESYLPLKIIPANSLTNGLEPILDLWKAFDDYHRDLSPYYFKQPTEEERVKRHKRYIENRDSLYLVCLIDDYIVGFICGQWRKTPNVCLLKERNILELHGIYISPDYQNYGCAGKLLDRAISLAHEARTDDIELFTWDFNEAVLKLLSNSGFKKISTKYGLSLHE
jgi:ribosomal protein S18 acetylase RimI-like enzyme